MRKLFLTTVMAVMLCTVPSVVKAAVPECSVTYSSTGDETSGITETTTVTVKYPSYSGAVYRWRVVGWCLTGEELGTYTIPEDVPKLTNVSSSLTGQSEKFVFDPKEVYDFAITNGVVPNYDSGEVQIFAQPIIGVEELRDGNWVVTETDLRSIELWTAAKDWKGVGQFKSLYNQPLKVRVSGNLSYDNGNGKLTKKVQCGAVRSLTDTGLTPTITKGNAIYTLSGVKITGAVTVGGEEADYNVGISLTEQTEDDRYSLLEGSNFVDASGNNLVFAKEGFVFTEERSGIYELLASARIRFGYDTVVEAKYDRIKKETVVLGRQSFFSGVTESLDIVLGNSFTESFSTPTSTISRSLSDYGVAETVKYAGTDKWQLNAVSVAKLGNSSVGDLGALLTVNGNTRASFDVTEGTISDWQDRIRSYGNSVFDASYGERGYVVQGEYVLYAPQVELSYFKDEKGELHLFGVTSGGNTFNSIDEMKRNFYGTDSSSYSFQRFKTEQQIDGATKDVVLTKAYSYAGPGVNSISGYLSDSKNCWTESSVPSGGETVRTTIDGGIEDVWTVSKDRALVEAVNGETGGSNFLEMRVDDTPMTPLIYVGIYEASPEVFCTSYVSAASSVTDATVFAQYAPVSGIVQYDNIDYQRGKKVSLAVGTTSLDAYRVYSQDGLDDGADASGRVYDDLRGYFESGGTILYCTRYAWITGDAVDAVLALGSNVTFADLKRAAGGALESSTLGGKFFLDGQRGMLLKVYTPEIVFDNSGVWKVGYYDLENSTGYGNVYGRLQRAQLTGDYRVLVENSTTDGSYLNYVAVLAGGTERKLELANVGHSLEANSSGQGYQGERGSGGIGGSTLKYHSALVDSVVAPDGYNALEKRAGIAWKTNPYSPSGGLAVGNYRDWFNSHFTNRNTADWNWYVYRYAKSYSSAVILQDSDDEGSYYTEEAYEKHALNVYSNTTVVSFQPFREDTISGKVYQLDKVVYGYTDEDVQEITAVELQRLESSKSFCHGYSGGTIQCQLSKRADAGRFISSVSYNTNVFSVDGEQLHVVAVYKVFNQEDAVQENPTITSDVISYRDSGKKGENGTDVWVEAASSNVSDLNSADVRFVGNIMSDVDNISDDYVADTAIPTTEFLRTSATVPKYLADIDYNHNKATISYTLDYCKGFYSKQEQSDSFGNVYGVYDGVCVEVRPDVVKEAENYSLYGATLWYPSDSTIWNYAITETLGQQLTMVGSSPSWINSEFGIFIGKDAQFVFQNFKAAGSMSELQISNGVELVSDLKAASDLYRVDVIQEDAESRIDPITATNQQVEFKNGEGGTTVLLEHGDASTIVKKPVDVPCAGAVPYDLIYSKGDTSRGLFSSKNDNTRLPWGGTQNSTVTMQIDKTKSNGIYTSTGSVRFVTDDNLIYQHGIQYNDVSDGNEKDDAESNGICFGLGVNRTVILTPVTVSVSITDESVDDQSIETSVGYPLVLDKEFTVATSAFGTHCGLPGYGSKNYAQYLATMSGSSKKAIRVRFPFTVVRISETNGTLTYDAVRAGQWLTIGLGSMKFVLPTFVEEDDLLAIQVRAYACNATSASQLAELEYGMNANRLKLGQGLTNTDEGWSYVAYRNVITTTIGRVYGLSVIDISDYPLWEDFFRNENQELTGNQFYSGLANANGRLRGNLSDRCFPVVDGNHPEYNNEGFSKTGYKVRFKLETVGSMYSADDIVTITPDFYWVDDDGDNREKAYLYYDKEVNGVKKRIRVGSAEDNRSMNSLSFSTGKFGVGLDRLERTSEILGFDDVQDFTTHTSPVYNFSGIQLNQYVRTFVGDEHSTDVLWSSVQLNKMIETDGASLNIPSDVVDRSVQQWYGEYYLPTNLHVTTDSDVSVYGDSGWKQDGYLIVNFTIRTVNGREYSLIYDAKSLNDGNESEMHYSAGQCDMWGNELKPVVKKSSNGTDFSLKNGDFLIYDVRDLGTDNASDDFSGGGTH